MPNILKNLRLVYIVLYLGFRSYLKIFLLNQLLLTMTNWVSQWVLQTLLQIAHLLKKLKAILLALHWMVCSSLLCIYLNVICWPVDNSKRIFFRFYLGLNQVDRFLNEVWFIFFLFLRITLVLVFGSLKEQYGVSCFNDKQFHAVADCLVLGELLFDFQLNSFIVFAVSKSFLKKLKRNYNIFFFKI